MSSVSSMSSVSISVWPWCTTALICFSLMNVLRFLRSFWLKSYLSHCYEFAGLCCCAGHRAILCQLFEAIVCSIFFFPCIVAKFCTNSPVSRDVCCFRTEAPERPQVQQHAVRCAQALRPRGSSDLQRRLRACLVWTGRHQNPRPRRSPSV